MTSHLPYDASLSIRRAVSGDALTVARLAALDSRRVPAGELLLAEVDGVPRAALALGSGAVVADPFAPTAHVVSLLHVRAAALRADDRRPRRAGLLRRRLAPRAA